MFLIAFLQAPIILFNFVRLNGWFNVAELGKFNGIVLLILFFSSFLYINQGRIRDIKVGFLGGFFFLIIPQGIITGWVLGNAVFDILSDAIVLILSALIFLFYRNLGANPEEDLNVSLIRISKLFLLCDVINVIVSYILKFSGYNFYFSVGSPFTLLPFVVFLLKEDYAKCSLVFLLILLGGKVGVIFSAVSVLIYFVFKKDIKSSIYLCVLSLLFLLFSSYLTNFGFFTSVSNKLQYYNPEVVFSEDFTLEQFLNFGGGRVSEVYYAIKGFYENLGDFGYIFGSGFGFKYEQSYFGYETLTKNVHFTPVSILTKSGIIAVFVFYFYLIKYSFKKQTTEELNIMRLFIFSMLIYSLTSYVIFHNLLIWVFLGILSRR